MNSTIGIGTQVQGRGRQLHLHTGFTIRPGWYFAGPIGRDRSMPDTGSNTFPVLAGDFSRAYALVNVADLHITVDDNVTAPGR